MKIQTYQNHSTIFSSRNRSQIIYYVTVITANVFAVINLLRALTAFSGRLSALLILLIAISLDDAYFMFRSFSLRAQDRAIRAEENLRYFAMTGKLLDKSLTIQQIIALRFAADEEFVALAERAVKEQLSNKEIKMAVKNWRGDYHRA